MGKGKFIVLYAPNNLGKTTQAKLLAEKIKGTYLKYPIYDLEPTGPRINSIIRPKEPLAEPMSALELQTLYAQNRRDFQPELQELLEDGQTIIAEDYTGTGIAWGMTEGIPFETLKAINKDLLVPDIEILLDGERFESGIERGHRFESGRWNVARENHLFLAEKYGWKKVDANQSVEKVHEDILRLVLNV